MPAPRAIGLAIAALLVSAGCSGPAVDADNGRTPAAHAAAGLGRQTAPPWDAPTDAVRFIQDAGLPPLKAEGSVVHYHAHLDVIVDGQPVPVPALIGIDEGARRISPLHTHDRSGVVHIEAPGKDSLSLGQLFTEWDVRLTQDCLGSLCADDGKALRLYVNGKQRSGDPSSLFLAKHQEIALVYGDATDSPAVPSSYDFPHGL